MTVRPLRQPKPEAASPLANPPGEAAFLGALLLDGTLIDELSALPTPADFSEAINARILALILEAHRSGNAVSVLTLLPHFTGDEQNYVASLTADGQGLLAPQALADQLILLSAKRRRREWHLSEADACLDPDRPLSDLAPPAEIQTKTKGLAFEWAGDAKPVLDGAWLIEGWLPRSGPAVIFGHPGCGKSFFALSIAAAVAEGKPWASRYVERGAVIYVAAEGQTGFRNRLAAMIEAGQLDRTAPFAFIPTALDLQAPASPDVAALIATIAQVTEHTRQRAALIVVDTLSKTFGGGKEVSDDMASYVANCEKVAAAFDALTLIVHHRPKDGSASERGHTSLRGGVVTSILIEGETIKTATTVKQKDGPDGERIAFRLEPYTLGQTSRGTDVTTCLVDIMEEDDFPHTARDPRQDLTGHSKTALKTIERLIASNGTAPPASIPADVIDRTAIASVLAAGHAADTLTAELEGLCDGSPDKRADTARRTAKRAIAKLKDLEILGSWGDWLWLK